MTIRQLLVAILIGVLCYGLYSVWTSHGTYQKIEVANEAYQTAISSKTIYERKTAFNEALRLYSELELSQEPVFGNGKLYNNMGNIYYELESYPWALLYYYRAQQLDLFNKDLEHNIQRTEETLGVSKASSYSVFQHLFFFHHYLTLPQRLQLFFISGLIAFLLASLALWFPKKPFVGGAVLSGVICFLFLASSTYSRYFEPTQAVLMKASLLAREVGIPNDWVTEKPTPSGTKLIVLDVFQEGAWLKVITPDGTLGYITADRIRII